MPQVVQTERTVGDYIGWLVLIFMIMCIVGAYFEAMV